MCISDLDLSVLFTVQSQKKGLIFGSDGNATFIFMITEDLHEEYKNNLVKKEDVISEAWAGFKSYHSYQSKPIIFYDRNDPNSELDLVFSVGDTSTSTFNWTTEQIDSWSSGRRFKSCRPDHNVQGLCESLLVK